MTDLNTAPGGVDPHPLAALPAGWALALLLVLLVAEVLAVPGVMLPGGTAVALVGALAGSGRVDTRAAAAAVTVTVLAADQLAFWAGDRVGRWLRRRFPGSRARSAGEAAGPDHADQHPRPAGWWRHLGLAAFPSLAGAARLPYRRFVLREVPLRAAWLPAFFLAGEIGGRSLVRFRSVSTAAAVLGGAVVAGVLLARRRRLVARWLTASRAETLLLVLLVAAGAATCTAVLQDLVEDRGTGQAGPGAAAVAASHLPAGLYAAAVAASRFVWPPGLFVTAGMAVILLDLARRGRSSVRFAVVVLAAVGGGGLLDLGFRHLNVPDASSAGLALVTALAVSVTVTAGHRRSAGTAALVGLAGLAAAAVLGGCLLATGLPAAIAAVGAGWGVTCAGLAELAARQGPAGCRSLLADDPPERRR